MARLSHCISLFCCLGILAVTSAGPVCAQAEPPLRGRQAGSERWIVWLKDRGFDLHARLRTIRAETNAASRRQLLAQLEQVVLADQQALVGQVTNAGGLVEKQLWVLSALAVDIPAVLVPVLRAHPRVRRMVPVRARHDADAASNAGTAAPVLPPPILLSTGANNHNVAGARTILTTHTNAQVARGLGAVVGFFDTGIDEDADGTTAGVQDHSWFTTAPPNPTTRILAHIRAGTIDCNNLRVPGAFGPLVAGVIHAYRPGDDSTSALHGTAMAGIAVGRDPSSSDGHAPAASIVDVSVTVPPQADPFPPYDLGNEYKNRWTTDDVTMLTAIQELRTFMADTATPVHVLNISWDGWANPFDPVAFAFDEMAITDDVLLVTSCGNASDETFLSNGFYNGLAVGSVHARTDPYGYSGPFAIMRETSRGPLSSNWQRYFPDVSATGAGPGFSSNNYNAWVFVGGGGLNSLWADLQLQMPKVDLLDNNALAGTTGVVPFGGPVPAGPVRYARGTSEAAAQVSGAAALYRAARLFFLPGVGATAQETRAAILISTIGGAQGDYVLFTQQAPGHSQTAYSSRNTVGAGYVRDDLLAEFAVRTGSNPIKALHQAVELQSEGEEQAIAYAGLTPGKRYVVAACWPRYVADEADHPIANVDLTIRVAGVSIARSRSPANSYERVAFVLPANVTAVEIVVSLTEPGPVLPVTVDVAAREFDPDRNPNTPATIDPMPIVAASGFYETLGPGSSCIGPARPLEPFRTVPAAYAGAYGSAMEQGLVMKGYNVAGPSWGSGLHIVLRNTQMGGATNIGGLAFRTWRPFTMTPPSQGLRVMSLRLENRPTAAVDVAELTYGTVANSTNVIPGHPGINYPLPGWPGGIPFGPDASINWVPFGFSEFPLVVPFDVPFAYNGGNLHIWINFDGLILVDGATDFGDEYGLAYQDSPGAFVTRPGSCPILALLPAAPATLPNLTPRLRIFGEPLLGAGLEVQIVDGPANTPVFLNFGTWAPNQVPGLCIEHIAQPFPANSGVLNYAGMARWSITLPADMLALHTDIAVQGTVLSNPNLRTNAMRAVLGGGL